MVELADAVGYEGEKVDTNNEDYKKQDKERKEKHFAEMKSDISAARIIHDPELRRAVMRVLRQSTDPPGVPAKGSPTLQDAYLRLEKWIFDPRLDYNSQGTKKRKD